MKTVLKRLKKIRFFNAIRRIYQASRYCIRKFKQILKWGVQSKEDTNFTFHLTESNLIYLAKTIAVVTGVKHTKVLALFNEIENDSAVKASISQSIAQSSFKHVTDSEIRFGKRLGWYAFARIMKPKVIIETGIGNGLGSVILCEALLKNEAEGHEGRYYGTDLNTEAGFLLTQKHKAVGEILYGDSIESLKKFKQPIDLFINDSDHSASYEFEEYLTIENLIHERSIILGDNAHCSHQLAQFSNQIAKEFLYFQEKPLNHWYPGAGIGIAYTRGLDLQEKNKVQGRQRQEATVHYYSQSTQQDRRP